MNFILNSHRSKLVSKCFQFLCSTPRKDNASFLKPRCLFSTSSDKSKWSESSPKPFTLIKIFDATPNSIGLQFQDNLKSDLSYIWLRDNCQCHECFDPENKDKFIDTVALDPNIKPKSLMIRKSGLEVVWEGLKDKNNHKSFYDSMWLHRYCLGFQTEPAMKDVLSSYHLWDKEEIACSQLEMSYDEVMESEKGLMKLLEQFHDFGLVVVKDVPLNTGEVVAVIQRFADIRNVKCSQTFQVMTKRTPAGPELENTGQYLEFHTDMNYLEKSPGIQALHCLEVEHSGELDHGIRHPGQFYFVDGFFAANWLKEHHPDNFFLLESIPMKFKKFAEDKEFVSYQYILSLATKRGLSEIHFDNRNMAPLEGPGYLVEGFYESYKMFGQKLRDPSLQVPLVMKPGDLVIFNNKRILHAKGKFDHTLSAERLEGCFGEMDEVLARMRFTSKQKLLE